MPSNFGWTLHRVPPEELNQAGFGDLVDVPFVRDGDLAYAELPNRFLIDLALGFWSIRGRDKDDSVDQGRSPPPTRESLKSVAYWLVNALEWADTRSVDLMNCDYVSVLGRYQEEMLQGIWSADGSPLQAATVNARVGAVLSYQQWGAAKKLREPVSIPTVTATYWAPSYRNSRSHETRTVKARKGKVRVTPKTLAFPKAKQIEAWCEAIKAHPTRGQTEGLLVDLILGTAIRREEAACWRVETLPMARREWKIINPDEPPEYQHVEVTIKYGAKGRQYGRDHGDKIGPANEIKLPLRLAERIDEYRQKLRPKALAAAVRQGKTLAQQRRIRDASVQLFLHPATGKRYSGKQIYSMWKRVESPAHWSPHLARHLWACNHLERRMRDQADLMTKILDIPGLTSSSPLLLGLADTAHSIIQLEITPQLRHVNSNTTDQYLEWWFAKNSLPYQTGAIWDDEDDEEEA
jgi:hypothetical protein